MTENQTIQLNTLLEGYLKETPTDKQVRFLEMQIDLIKIIEEHGIGHLHTAQHVMKMTDECSMKRGLWKDLLMLRVDTEDSMKRNVDNYVRPRNKKEFITTELFNAKLEEYKGLVGCYAVMDEYYYRSRTKGEGRLIQHMLDNNLSLTESEIKKLVDESDGNFLMHTYWNSYCIGECIIHGWIITVDDKDGEKLYTVRPVGWDGNNVPEGGMDYPTFKKK